jgi:hypothetical protein
MWRPESVGEVIAERVCDLRRGGRKVGRVTITFGRPVRAPGPERPDRWWCPVRIAGSGLDLFRPIAGDDSLQALILALEFAADILPDQARSLRAGLDWLGQPEKLILARQGHSADPDNAFAALLARLRRNRDQRRTDGSTSTTSERRRPSLRAVSRRSPRARSRS